ncbi:uncharacterized protein A1O9_12057 [Exophiala aquamarina CBS 119918]|uniref:Uncharacterized protein n=1 Tax=Exophiala aquamarina CBS 119918 TaxID=1182545 RepID=A0A072NXB3_9EURO|nr:uncharacterized protein A1O9_12057 [Exophiala aquamarina CBS 119918]KEF52067.1 hypothetical protein A1O9_12057 [Exophiala aquamarina CBS 119918]
MAPSRFDSGTGGTNYSSIHSADAFVGTYQVMYTPGSTSPHSDRAHKKSTRFSKAASIRSHNQSQSFILPANIPNTSQIVADQGSLPDVQVHYSIPADEKQIVASLRTLQRDLNEAIQTINSLTRERDEALLELRLLRAASVKETTRTKKTTRISSHQQEEELFDLSRSIETPQRSPARKVSSKRFGADTKQAGKTTISDDARVLSPVEINGPLSPTPDKRWTSGTTGNSPNKSQAHKKPTVNDTENSVVEDPTAASNTSRRRRHLDLDENMTSAYILPDITVSQSQAQGISKGAQTVLHRHDPEHVQNCEVCLRLTGSKKTKHVTHASRKSTHINTTSGRQASKSAKEQDFTVQITQLMKSAMLDDPTIRPKISPWHALANVKKLLTDQFEEAKRKHGIAWETYDGIEAPLSSKRHAAISEELFYWSRKMEECRVNLDQLRDVEEGMRGEDEN